MNLCAGEVVDLASVQRYPPESGETEARLGLKQHLQALRGAASDVSVEACTVQFPYSASSCRRDKPCIVHRAETDAPSQFRSSQHVSGNCSDRSMPRRVLPGQLRLDIW